MSDNPFQAPPVMHPSKAPDSFQGLEETAEMLWKTRPWVRFVSVMMFIASLLMIAGAVFGLVLGNIGGRQGAPVIFSLVYVVMSLMYAIPASYLWAYADRIGVFLADRTTVSLARALQMQKSFWKFVGIALIIVVCVYVGLFVIAMALLPLMM